METILVIAVNDENEFEIIATSALGSTTPELSSECHIIKNIPVQLYVLEHLMI